MRVGFRLNVPLIMKAIVKPVMSQEEVTESIMSVEEIKEKLEPERWGSSIRLHDTMVKARECSSGNPCHNYML